MNYKNHLRLGFFVTLAFVITYLISNKEIFTLRYSFLLLITIYLGSLFPDLDHWKSKIRKYLFTFIFAGLIVFGFFYKLNSMTTILLILAGIAGLLIIYSKHRKFFHTSYMGFLAATPIAIYDLKLGVAFFIAFMTHITSDYLYSKGKRKSRKFLKDHPTFASILERLGIVRRTARYEWKWLENL